MLRKILILNNMTISIYLWIIIASTSGFAAATIIFVVFGKFQKNDTISSKKQLSQQMLMADISRSFLNDKDTNTLITKTLQMVGEFMDISQILFFQLKDDNVTLSCRNEWINPKLGLASRIDSILPLKEPMLSIVKNFKPNSGHNSCLSSNDPIIRKAMSPYRVSFKNYITTPVFIRDELFGVIDLSKEGIARPWSDSEISLATLFASTLSGVYERQAMGRRTSIVENSPFMIFYSDINGNMSYANPAAVTVTGYTLAELYKDGFKLIFSEKEVQRIKDEYVPYTQNIGVLKHEINLICKNGKILIVEITSFKLNDGMTAAICFDLTDKHALEAEIIKQKENAERASDAKSQFLSNMSHEMRTPMNAIIGMTEVAIKSSDCSRKKYALEKVSESSKHLLRIINDILDMSKIEANKLELAEAQFNLRNLLHKAISFLRLRMDEKKLKFVLNIDNNVPSFYIGDDQRLTQVLTNLLSNAYKFTPEDGKISLSVFLQAKENNNSVLRFEVTDSGIGISSEQQKRLFHAFEQADSGTTRKYGGTGLGLTISKRIVELMGGSVWIESEIGKGTKFSFTVNLKRDAVGEGKESIENKSIAPIADNEFAGRRVLLAEDIEINREIFISLLDNTGLTIDIAENGKEALEKVTAGFVDTQNSYDMVLMDVQMPEMDGLEATRQIREFEHVLDIGKGANRSYNEISLLNKSMEFSKQVDDCYTSFTDGSMEFASQVNGCTSFTAGKTRSDNRNLRKQIPIIAMTANVFKEDIDKCIAAGMNDHIGKPLEMDTVIEKLRMYLNAAA